MIFGTVPKNEGGKIMAGYSGLPVKIFKDRVEVLVKKINSEKVDGLFIFSDEYRTGYSTYISDFKPINMIEESPQGVFINKNGNVTLFLGAINAQAAKKVSWIEDIRDIETIGDFFDDISEKKGDKLTIGLSGEDLLPTRYYRIIEKILENKIYKNWDEVLHNMRMIKCDEEIALQKIACEIGDESLRTILKKLDTDEELTEIGLCAVSEYTMKKMGGDLSCATVLASGINTKVPTWRPTHRVIEDGDPILIDVAPAYNGYGTDVAITVFKGKCTKEQKRIIDAARDVVLLSVDTLKPGEPGSRIYDLFLEKSIELGVDQYFTPYAVGLRAVGHSIGLDCVERPNLDKDSSFILTKGMTLALKYDLHGFEWGGLRIESVFVVEDDKCTLLNKILYEI